MVHGHAINIDNLDKEEYVAFWTKLISKVLPSAQRGNVDFFVPLASCGKFKEKNVNIVDCIITIAFNFIVNNCFVYNSESGNEMITQLGILTGMKFTSPSGIIGNYNHGKWHCNF